MKRINLVKHGFVRWPEQDFHDDGNNFTCYKAGKKIRVSKLVADGQVYLSADSEAGNGTLPYEIYSKLPHYQASNWKLNGVSQETLTEDDLENFMAACLAYELEYEAAEKNIKYPTLEELKEQCQKIYDKVVKELDEVEKVFGTRGVELAAKCTEWEWKELRRYLTELINKLIRFDPNKYPDSIYKTSYSFDFVKSTYGEVAKPSFYYEQIKEIFQKYHIS